MAIACHLLTDLHEYTDALQCAGIQGSSWPSAPLIPHRIRGVNWSSEEVARHLYRFGLSMFEAQAFFVRYTREYVVNHLPPPIAPDWSRYPEQAAMPEPPNWPLKAKIKPPTDIRREKRQVK